MLRKSPTLTTKAQQRGISRRAVEKQSEIQSLTMAINGGAAMKTGCCAKVSFLIFIIVSGVVFFGQIGDLCAVPAYPHPIVIDQRDGSQITVTLGGDERAKWAETKDGYTVLANPEMIYEYAVHDEMGNLVRSGVKARNPEERLSEEHAFLSRIPKGLRFSPNQVRLIKTIEQIYEREMELIKAFPTTGNRKLLCILIGYQDKAFTRTKAEVENLFNQIGYTADGAAGSVRDFYRESSYNQLDLSVTVVGPYTASQNMAYYGANDSWGDDVRPRELVTEAVNLADPDVNYADFDNDNDGAVDGVYVLFAGYGEEAGGGANCIWSHAWSIPSITRDGKTISRYSCSPELRNNSGSNLTRIGVIGHEFGHVLGAPDFYDTNYSTGGQFQGTGYWDMMASGSWNNNGATPAQHNAFTKIYKYNWASATTLTLANSVQNKTSFYRYDTTTSGEYFLLENRQQVGFDAQLPGHGLLIYHVHKDVNTVGNVINAGHPQKFYPVCASATTNPSSEPSSYGSINSTGTPFPGSTNKTAFSDDTIPHSRSWAGAATNKPLSNVVENTANKTVSLYFGTQRQKKMIVAPWLLLLLE
jgi:M6 family metalloprotease-like protein